MSKQLSRRDFLKKSLGAAGLVTVAASPLVLLSRAGASEDSPPEATAHGTRRAWSMVIDLKKCEGCVTIDSPPQCTQACIAGHYIPKGQEWIQVFEVDMPGGGSYFMPTPCFHCEAAPCVNVCPVAATYHTDEGVVLIDQCAASAVVSAWRLALTSGVSSTGANRTSQPRLYSPSTPRRHRYRRSRGP